MRQCTTAVLEQGNTFEADFETEPFEAGWASRARWFVRVLDASGDGLELEMEPQVSPDGLIWCGFTGSQVARAPLPPLLTFTTTDHGNWLRLAVRLRGHAPRVKVVIYLVLNE